MSSSGKNSQSPLVFKSSGDTGLTIALGDFISRDTSGRVLRLRQAIEAAGLPGVIETVPTFTSVLVHYSPMLTSQEELKNCIRGLEFDEGETLDTSAKSWLFPICFDGPDFAPDLNDVASWAGISSVDVCDDILKVEQSVYMLGFAPGQPYIGDLPERLNIPRRKEPVLGVASGSVVIATGKTVIYPVSNPTGWHVVGRVPVKLFNSESGRPVLLSPGDKITFRAVDYEEFLKLEENSKTPDFDPRSEFEL